MNEPVSVQAVEVLVAEVPVRLAGAEHVPRDDHDGVAHGRLTRPGPATSRLPRSLLGSLTVYDLPAHHGQAGRRLCQFVEGRREWIAI